MFGGESNSLLAKFCSERRHINSMLHVVSHCVMIQGDPTPLKLAYLILILVCDEDLEARHVSLCWAPEA